MKPLLQCLVLALAAPLIIAMVVTAVAYEGAASLHDYLFG